MLLFLLPLVQKDDDEHGCHHKVHTLGAEGQDRAHHRAETRAGDPVDLVQQGDEEHEPAPVHPFRRFGGAGDGEGLVAHGVDHIKTAQPVALVPLQHGKAVEQMPRLDHQGHQEGRQRRKSPQQKACQHELQRAAVDDGAHQHGHPDRQPQRLHVNAVPYAQHEIPGKHRHRLGGGCFQRPEHGAGGLRCDLGIFHIH